MPLFPRKASRLGVALAASGILALALAVGAVPDKKGTSAANNDEEFLRFIDVSAEVYSNIRGKYVDDIEPRKVLEAGLRGMFQSLDEHSQYMDPDTLDQLTKDTGGEFSGIGIHITMRQGLITVIAPMPGSPAAALGILPWDRIVEIEGETTEKMVLQDAVRKLTGPPGTQVKFKVYREGQDKPLEFKVTRATVKIDSVHSKLYDGGVGYIRISKFSENTTTDMRRALAELKHEGMKSLVLDLRFNGGGLLREAIDVGNLFIERGQLVVSTKGRLKGQNREYYATADPMVPNIPLFVLVNEGSASASEIVAGAIQDHHLGVIIGPSGKHTFGKGSVQTIENLSNSMSDDENGNPRDSAIRLTTAKYYTPSGRTIHHIGITPDIGVPLKREEVVALVRHGLLGDVNTNEEFPDDTVQEVDEDEVERSGQGLVIKKDKDAKATPTPTPAPTKDPKATFFEGVKTPKLRGDDKFVDAMLDEALKQMRIYMILQEKSQKGLDRVLPAKPAKEFSQAVKP